MKKYLSLVKLLFVQQYRIKPIVGRRKKGGAIVMYVLLAACCLPMIFGLATSMYFVGLLSQGAENVSNVCAMLMLLCQGVVLLFGIPMLISNVFTAKDGDKLLFLPVKSLTIFASKLTVAYLNEVITTAVMLIATLLPFGIGLKAGAGYFLLLVLALLFIPVLPLLFGSVIAIPLSAITVKLGKNGVAKTVLQTLMFLTIMFVYMFGMYKLGFWGGSMGDDATNMDIAEVLISKLSGLGEKIKYLHSNFTLALAMTSTGVGACLLNLLITVAENVALLGIVLLMAMPSYHWMLTSSVEGVGGKVKRSAKPSEIKVKNQGVLKELIFTDLKRVARDNQMGFQSVVSFIMLPIMVVVFYFAFRMGGGDEMDFISKYSSNAFYQAIAPLVMLAIISLLGMSSNVLGLYPISRENKSVYLIKSLPISFNKILLAKVILATSVMIIVDFITCVLLVVLFKVEWYYGIAMLVTMALLEFGAMCITTLIDLKSPKIGWTNFNQSLKNAKNGWLASLVGVITSAIIGTVAAVFLLLWYFTGGWYVLLIMWLILIGACFGFAVVCYKIMIRKAQQHFDNIEP